ncbi:MAG: cytochrome P460 family protein, partial [Candidatus Dormibacteraceae bacterium]
MFALAIGLTISATIWASAPGSPSAASTPSSPQYTAGGRLKFPQGYREWIYLSSGLGMNYGPSSSGTPAFTNVFVAPAAYRSFLATGHWPD